MMAIHLHLAEDLASCENFHANPIQLTKRGEHLKHVANHAPLANFPTNFVFPPALLLASL